jgi:LL-diaminopimelate aminotransferase
VLPLLGSKEGIAHLPTALCEVGDVVLCPDPCYPPYVGGAVLAGAEPVMMPLQEESGFFPDFGDLSQRAANRAKILYLNYPNNPTAALATQEQFQQALDFAQEYNICVAHDAAYSEIAFDGIKPISFLQLPGAKELGIEFHSVSKTYNMTGWRIGWVAGNAQVIAALAQLKSNLDSGIFQPLQWAAIEALEGDQSSLQQAVATYQKRRDLLVDGLNEVGWQVSKPQASLYTWSKVPGGLPSMAFSQRILQKAHVVVTPGVGFGQGGEGYFRMSLTVPTGRIEEAITRMRRVL